MFLQEQFDNLADQFLEALVKDASNPEMREYLKEQAGGIVSKLIGVDVGNPLVRQFWDAAYNQIEDYVVANTGEFVALSLSNPPHSVDTAATLIKEEVADKVDTFADKLKRKLAEQNKEQ